MPLSNLQHDILCVLAERRAPDSYVAGSTPLNRDGPRYSGDIDIFHDSEERVATTAIADTATLAANGFAIEWVRQQPGIYTVKVIPTGRKHAAGMGTRQ